MANEIIKIEQMQEFKNKMEYSKDSYILGSSNGVALTTTTSEQTSITLRTPLEKGVYLLTFRIDMDYTKFNADNQIVYNIRLNGTSTNVGVVETLVGTNAKQRFSRFSVVVSSSTDISSVQFYCTAINSAFTTSSPSPKLHFMTFARLPI